MERAAAEPESAITSAARGNALIAPSLSPLKTLANARRNNNKRKKEKQRDEEEEAAGDDGETVNEHRNTSSCEK